MIRRLVHGLHFDNVRGDVYGGLTAAVVALPLALAFGVASGAGPVAGVYGAIFVGFFAAVFGGTPAQVSGPTGPMTVVTAAIITQFAHDPALAFTVVMMAGLMQIGFGLLRLGRYINLVPYPVISGFMSGIGCIIVTLQLAPLVGELNPSGEPLAAMGAWPRTLSDPLGPALVLGLVAFGIATFLPRSIGRYIPAPLLALTVGVALSLTVLGGAPVLGEVPGGFPSPQLPTLSLSVLPSMVKSALVLALLGAIDSLLTSLVADSVTQTRHDSDRELVGQGIGNTIAGLMGAIPGAGATMRTVVNVRAGGRTPISGALHAVVLLTVMLGLGPFAAHIPHAVLAGILIKVGIDIIDWDYLKRIRRAPAAGVVMMLVVLSLTVFVDLITAVTVGVVMASLLFVKRMSDLQLHTMEVYGGVGEGPHDSRLSPSEVESLREGGGRVVLVRLNGPMSFGAASEMARRLDAAGEYEVLVLDLAAVPFVDSSTALALEGVIRRARLYHKRVILVGMKGPVARILAKLGVFQQLGPGGRFHSRARALAHAAALVVRSD